MSKFKNRLASIVLSTITLAGGVTTCFISDSAVHQCKAIITDEEMKKLINEALKDSFQQDPSLPQITADNLKTVLQKALDTITNGKQGKQLTKEERTELQTLVNTFLYILSNCLADHLLSSLPNWTDRSLVLTEANRNILWSYSPGRELSMAFMGIFQRLIETQVPTHQNYFPKNFLFDWGLEATLRKPANAWQVLLGTNGEENL